MNIYTFDIFSNYWTAVESYDGPFRYNYMFDDLKVGPLNLPEVLNLAIIKEAVLGISTHSIPSAWWTGFSSWEDYFGLLRTGTKLPMHSVVVELNRNLEKIVSGNCTIDHVSANGDITFDLNEDFPTLMKGYKITAKRKRLRTLKQIAAYNVAKYISGKSDIMKLQIPQSLNRLVSIFLDTYSGDYMRI